MKAPVDGGGEAKEEKTTAAARQRRAAGRAESRSGAAGKQAETPGFLRLCGRWNLQGSALPRYN